jgi:probable HAF family extracellular repeat protein
MPINTFNTFNVPSAFTGETQAWGVNDTGQIVGYYNDNTGIHGFLESGGTYTALNDPMAMSATWAIGINNVGQVVGHFTNAGFHGFLYNGGTYTTLDDPSGNNGTFAWGVNASGQIVGFYTNNVTGNHGFLYSGGIYTALDDPLAPFGTTHAYGINASGQIVEYYADGGGQHGFLRNPNGTYTTLNDPLATNSTIAYGINDAGQIVGTYNTSDGTHAFLYSGGVFTTMDDPAANSHTFAYGINNNSQIVGTLSDGTGNHGFLETTVPNPPPPAGTTADLILRRDDGAYEIYDIGNNAILAAYPLGQVGTDWQFAGLGSVQAGGETAMFLRQQNGQGTTGSFEIYNISNNNIVSAALLGQLAGYVQGIGNFGSRGENDVMLRDGAEAFSVVDIANDQSPALLHWGALGSIGSSEASAISAAIPANTTCSCATRTPEACRSTTSPTTRSPIPPSWVRSGWIGSSLASAISVAPPAKPT